MPALSGHERPGAMGRATGVALAGLLAGFALVDLPPVRAGFDGLALVLAAAAAAVLNLGGLSVLRAGAELRETLAGWGMEVTRVCDGHGLAVAAAALVAALLAGWWRRAAMAFLAALAAIQLFNLLRILVLGLVLHQAPAAFDWVHLDVFPLLTAALFLIGAGGLAGVAWRRVALALLLTLVLAALWIGFGAGLAAGPLAAGANLLLGLAGPPGIGPIAPRPDGWLVETMMVTGQEPVVLLRAPIWPADFAVALPVLLAAALAAPGRRGVLALAAALAVMGLALALGALTEVWAATAQAMVAGVLAGVPGQGGLALVPHVPPPEGLVTAVRLVQNVLVHFNLLILPGLILAFAAGPERGPR